MEVNGTAIHGTHPMAPYQEGRFRFTRGKNGRLNAIYLAEAGEEPPASISLRGLHPAPGARMQLLGSDVPLAWKKRDGITIVELPASERQRLSGALAWTLRVAAAA
jgi:alpha-L-fucosidase